MLNSLERSTSKVLSLEGRMSLEYEYESYLGVKIRGRKMDIVQFGRN
jgi:hypothetical protein